MTIVELSGDILIGIGIPVLFFYIYILMENFARLRNYASDAIQNGKPVMWLDTAFGKMPVYQWSPPWSMRWWVQGRMNLRGMLVSRNDGHILMHGDRLQPAALLLHKDLWKYPEVLNRQIEHALGHTRIAVAGGGRRIQVIRNYWYDMIDSSRVNQLERRVMKR